MGSKLQQRLAQSSIPSQFQVNGVDVSQSSHDEAVEAFLAAEEPITVEVLRRNNNGLNSNAASDTTSASSKRSSVYIPASDAAIQTDVVLGGIDVVGVHPDEEEELMAMAELEYEASVGQTQTRPSAAGANLDFFSGKPQKMYRGKCQFFYPCDHFTEDYAHPPAHMQPGIIIITCVPKQFS